MLFMAIFSFMPEDRDKVIERRMGSQGKDAPGFKGEWFDISGHRVFRLFEAEDASRLAAACYDWTDVGTVEVIPVMETEKALKLLDRAGKATARKGKK